MQLRELEGGNMKEHVPEKKMADFNYWLGLQVFKDYRGTLGNAESFIREILEDKKSKFYSASPSSFKRKCDNVLGADVRTLIGKVMQLAKNGNKEFSEEILRALFRKDYCLPGEIDSAKLVPFTIVMLEPNRTKNIIRYVINSIFHSELEFFYGMEEKPANRTIQPEVGKLDDTLPSLRNFLEIFNEKRLHQSDSFIKASYAKDILEKHLLCVLELFKAGGRGLHLYDRFQHVDGESPFQYGCNWIPREMWPRMPDSLNYLSQYLCFIAKGEQKDIRALFPREAEIGTWQLLVPENVLDQQDQFIVGIHEENVHGKWAQKWPMFVSKGEKPNFSSLRAIAIPHIYKELAKEYAVFTIEGLRMNNPLQVLFRFSEYPESQERRLFARSI